MPSNNIKSDTVSQPVRKNRFAIRFVLLALGLLAFWAFVVQTDIGRSLSCAFVESGHCRFTNLGDLGTLVTKNTSDAKMIDDKLILTDKSKEENPSLIYEITNMKKNVAYKLAMDMDETAKRIPFSRMVLTFKDGDRLIDKFEFLLDRRKGRVRQRFGVGKNEKKPPEQWRMSRYRGGWRVQFNIQGLQQADTFIMAINPAHGTGQTGSLSLRGIYVSPADEPA